jgi:hypothetical protein
MIKRPRYRNVKTEVNGIKFDSKKEARRYETLVLLEVAGKIDDLHIQPRFEIVDGLTYHGETLRKRSYVADFMYNEGDIKVVEDVKSEITKKDPVYRLKRHLFLAKYGLFYDFREV